MTQRKCYPASLLSIENRRKNHNPKSGYSGAFLLLFPKSKRFCTFDTTAWRAKVKRSCGGLWVAPLFWPIMVQKIHCVFRPTKWTRKKNRREQRTEKIASRNFCLPIFANKISKNREKSLDQKTHNIRF